MGTMTVRERMLGVLRGQEHDRVPFAQYVLSKRFCESFPLREEVTAELGPDSVGFIRLVGIFRHEAPNCRWEWETIQHDGREAVKSTIITPKGSLSEIRLLDPLLHSTAAASHYVKSPEDYEIMKFILQDSHVVADLDDFHDAVQSLGDSGLPYCYLPRTPYQQLWIEWVGIEDLAYHLAEYEDLMESVIDLMRQHNRKTYECVCQIVQETEIPYLVFGENLTAPMIGDYYFRKYSLPAYQEFGDMLAETGVHVPVFAHTDGWLKPLWDAFDEARLDGFESLSPPPDNDTSVADVLNRWPDKKMLVNFPSPAHLFEPDEIYATAMTILEEGQRRGQLQIQISEDIPPGIWRKSYPHIIRAIQDFGAAC